MTPTDDREAVEAVLRMSYAEQRKAMLSGDADALGKLLAADFTLTHMTGYRQSRAEWLADVRSGEMSYHSIEDVNIKVEVVDEAVLTARTKTSATIWGSRGRWPLQLEIHFTQDGHRWLAAYTIASIW
ncbi:MAG TPA: nuclear transport factor 2 family protein [Propionibacteriaceae bacterium]|nr:nuclear transport factor 2 family protein [Propionibacteriaceae bacterium]